MSKCECVKCLSDMICKDEGTTCKILQEKDLCRGTCEDKNISTLILLDEYVKEHFDLPPGSNIGLYGTHESLNKLIPLISKKYLFKKDGIITGYNKAIIEPINDKGYKYTCISSSSLNKDQLILMPLRDKSDEVIIKMEVESYFTLGDKEISPCPTKRYQYDVLPIKAIVKNNL